MGNGPRKNALNLWMWIGIMGQIKEGKVDPWWRRVLYRVLSQFYGFIFYISVSE